MLRRTFATLVATIAVSLALPTAASAEMKTGYASVGGLEMYYEIHGAGRPLVLLHGALMTIEGFGKLLPPLAQTRQVIAIEQQAHGRTADIDRPFSYERMADDTAALLREIGIEGADFFGYSMGGAIALQVAVRDPELVRKLVLAARRLLPRGAREHPQPET
jgi:pimeloyl-ACP methyl ester carboxylesterase